MRPFLAIVFLLVIGCLAIMPIVGLGGSQGMSSYGKIGYWVRIGDQRIRLTGVNINLFPIKVFTDEHFKMIVAWGMNSVVINFGWNYLEPTRGSFDTTYLTKLDIIIGKIKQQGMSVILRMHTWGYALESGGRDPNYFFSFPEWVGRNPDFWENGNNQLDWVQMWGKLADYYRDEKTVIGFNLFAEPGREIRYAYNDTDPWSWNSRACQKVSEILFQPRHLYRDVIDIIHEKAPDKIVIFEGFSGYVIRYLPQGSSELIFVENPHRSNIAWGRTLYQSFNWSFPLYTDIVYGQWKIPYMITEFGIRSKTVSEPSPEDLVWLQDSLKRFTDNGFSWAYWGFGPGKNDYNLIDEDGSVSPAVSILSFYTFSTP